MCPIVLSTAPVWASEAAWLPSLLLKQEKSISTPISNHSSHETDPGHRQQSD